MKRFIILGAFLLLFGTLFAGWGTIRKVTGQIVEYFYADPDMGRFRNEKGGMSREEFMLRRAEGVAMKRGIIEGQPFDPGLRPAAIFELDRQEELRATLPESQAKNSLLATWSEIGPAPIPNGQTTTNSVAVSGRVTAIAIHPTNPDIVYVGTAQGGLYRTTDGGTNWAPLFDSAQSLAIGAIAIAPSQTETVYVGTGEPNFSADSFFGVGLYRIENASTTATLNGPFGTAQFNGRSISEIIVHPTIPGTIFVSSTSGIGGLRPAVPAGLPPRGVFRSTDATSASPTFTKDPLTSGGPSDHNVRDMAIDPTNPNILIITSSSFGVVRFSTALTTFSLGFTLPCVVTCGSGSLEIASQRSGAASAATFYVVSGIGNGRVIRSIDGGVTWATRITNGFCGGQCFYNLAVAVDPTNPDNTYIGGQAATQGLITGRSTNGGTSFTTVNFELHADTHAVEVAPSNSTIVWTGNDGGIFKSTDSGQTYTSMNNTQFAATQFMSIDVHPTDANFSLGGTQDNGTNFYQPAGTWTRADFGDGGWAVIDQNAPDLVNVRMYHTYFNASSLQGYGTVANTTLASDGNWAFRGCQAAGATVNGITCNGTVNFYAPLERGPGNPNTIYYGSDRLYRSADMGLNHAVVSQNPIVSGVPISSIGISPQNDNVRIVGLNNGALFGTTTGANPLVDLDPANTIPNVGVARTIVDPGNSNTAYVTLSAFGVTNVWKTTNLNGAPPIWINASGSGMNTLPQVPVNAIVIDPLNSQSVYVGTDIGVFTSQDGGINWFPLGAGLPRVAVFDIAITSSAPRQVRIATHGRGLWQHAALAPTAANVGIAGRVYTPDGRGLRNAVVVLTDSSGVSRTALTSTFGYYRLFDIPAGQTYAISVSAKRYTFTARVVSVTDELTDLDFIAEAPVKP